MDTGQLHYLVTGGAGFIGSNLVRHLLQDDQVRITCIDNFDPFYDIRIKQANIRDLEATGRFQLLPINLDTLTVTQLEAALPTAPLVVVHLAARAGVRPSILNPTAYQQTNVMATQVLLDYAVKAKVQKFNFLIDKYVYTCVNNNIGPSNLNPCSCKANICIAATAANTKAAV